MGVSAHAFLTTPGATKWYRAEAGARSAQHTRLQVAADACCEWLPQESIYFDGVNASTELDVRLGAGARFIGQEITCLGRRASGERFLRGSLAQRVRVSVAERPVFVEQGRLSPVSGLMQAEIGFNGCSVAATLLAVGALGKTGQVVVQACRAALAEATGAELATNSATNFATLGAARLGVTRMTPQACPGTDVLVVRYLGQSSEEARRALLLCWQVIRPALLGVPAVTPRIWNT